MIYIGDGKTDVPAMKLIKMQGGTSIGVYDPNTSKMGVHKLLKQDRISYSAKADYQDQSELDVIIKTIVDKISATASIKKFAKKYKKTIC